MKATIQKWLQFSKSDLETAEYLCKKPKANQWTYLQVVWHCHQSIEKILKAIIIDKNKELLYIHDLPKLSKIAELERLSEGSKNFLLVLNQYYLAPRYPDLPLRRNYPLVNQRKAIEILAGTKDLFLCLKRELN